MGSHKIKLGHLPTPQLLITSRAGNTINLSWSLPRAYPYVAAYTVERGTNGITFPVTVYSGLNTTVSDAVTAVSGQRLYYRVRYTDISDKISSYSNTPYSVVYAPVFSDLAPTTRTFTSAGDTYAWAPWVTDVDATEVFTWTLPVKYRTDIQINPSTGVMTVPGTAAGTQGTVTVRVTDKYGLYDEHTLTVIVQAPAGVQKVYPTSNVTQTRFTGGYAEIDEAVASDSDFAYGDNNAVATLTVQLPTIPTPQSGTCNVRYRVAKVNSNTAAVLSTGNAVSVTLSVLQGGNVIATDVARSTTGVWTQYTLSFSTSLVANWSTPLQVRLVTTASGGSGSGANNTRRGGAISWLEFEAPESAPDVQAPVIGVFNTPTVTSNSISLSWTAATDNVGVTSYTLERSLDQSAWTNTGYSGVSLSYVDTPLNPETRYYYRLRAWDQAGNFSSYAYTNALTSAVSTGTQWGPWPTQSPTYLPIVRNGCGPGMNTSAGSGRAAGVSAATWISRAGTATGITRPRIYRIDDLNDTDTIAQVGADPYLWHGTLRGAINHHNNATGPSAVVFETSGTINLGHISELRINRGNLSIYGQTAPNPGVQICRDELYIFESDVLIQHMTLRRGDHDATTVRDSLSIGDYLEPAKPITGVVIDHCTIQWGMDECIEIVYAPNVATFSNCIIAEPLAKGLPTAGQGGMSTNEVAGELLLFGNLWVTCLYRMPLSLYGKLGVVNNVMYNMEFCGTYLQNNASVRSDNSLVGNDYRLGPLNASSVPVLVGNPSDTNLVMYTSSQVRIEGCGGYAAGSGSSWVTPSTDVASQWALADVNVSSLHPNGPVKATSRPYWPEGLVEKPVTSDADLLAVRNAALDFAGSRPTNRDAVTTQLVADAASNSGRSLVRQKGTDGTKKTTAPYPTYAANTRAFVIPDNYWYIGTSGYTLLEEYIYDNYESPLYPAF